MAVLDDGSSAVYRPVSEEFGMPDLGRREVAVSRLDEMLGFGRVPTTAMIDGPRGPGSLQEFVVGAAEGLAAGRYPLVQQQQLAVLDYVAGNTARHVGSYLTGPDGGIVAVDHGFTFPDGGPIRSDFVRDHRERPLEVVDAVRAVDPARMRHMLRDSGLGPLAIDLAAARLEEVQRHGMITGESSPGAPTFVGATTGAAPTKVALYANNTGAPRRVAEFHRSPTGGVRLTVLDPEWSGLARQYVERGVELVSERRTVMPAEGAAFLRALLQPFRMNYYSLRDASR